MNKNIKTTKGTRETKTKQVNTCQCKKVDKCERTEKGQGRCSMRKCPAYKSPK